MTALLAATGRTFSSLRTSRNYRLYFTGQVVTLCGGTWMQDTALPWLILQITNSPTQVGLLVFCRYIPFTIFGLFAGALADRFDNRRSLRATQFASAVVAGALAVSTFTTTRPWIFFVLAALGGVAAVFENSSRNALIFQLVGREQLSNAVALGTGLANAARVAGPAIAGVVIATLGSGWCFAINACAFVVGAMLLSRVHDLIPLDRSETQRKTIAAIREGLAHTARTRRVKVILVLIAAISVAGFNFRVLLPILADKTLDVGSEGLGMLWALFGAGALGGALMAAATGRGSVRRLIAGSGLFSLALLALAPMKTTVGAGILLFAIGVSFTVLNAHGQMIIQLGTPDRLRGRVISLYTFAFAGLAPIGGLLAGWLAGVGGTVLAFGVAGIVGLGATVFAGDRLHKIRITPRSEPLEVAARLPDPVD